MVAPSAFLAWGMVKATQLCRHAAGDRGAVVAVISGSRMLPCKTRMLRYIVPRKRQIIRNSVHTKS